jgi:hypothetical protein
MCVREKRAAKPPSKWKLAAIALAEAKAAGLKYYRTGKTCARGHVAPRWVSSRECVECSREAARIRLLAEPLRAEAMAAGKKHYFTGVPCVNGHVARRQVSSGQCFECHNEAAAKYRAESPEKARAYGRAYRAKHREKVIARMREYYAKHPDTNRARSANTSARKLALEGALTEHDIARKRVEHGGKCAFCGVKLDRTNEQYHANVPRPLELALQCAIALRPL